MQPLSAQRSERHAWRLVGRIASVGFGAFILVTSAAGIVLGVQAGNGWLAILYGLLGCSMGLAGIAGTFVARPLRSALFGWFLLGIALRTVLDGGVYLLWITFPIPVVLLGVLLYELTRRPSRSDTTAALGGGALALATLVLLALAAPSLPVICPPPGSGLLISYPPADFPWEQAEHHYTDVC